MTSKTQAMSRATPYCCSFDCYLTESNSFLISHSEFIRNALKYQLPNYSTDFEPTASIGMNFGHFF